MAASAVQNPPVQGDSKSAKKKKAKAADRNASPAPAVSATPEQPASVAGGDTAQDDGPENAYIRDLQKSIRAITKRLANVSKTVTLIKEHSTKSLDELVTLKIINPDQKAQYLKKPELEAQIADLEAQINQHKKLQEIFQKRLVEQEKSLTEKFDAAKAALTAELEEKAVSEADTKLRQNLLVVSQFLRLAAARRAEDVDPAADENLALEGVLLSVYSGDDNAVAAMLKLVNGAEEPTQSTAGEPLQTTFAQIKSIAVAHSAALFPDAPAELDASEVKDVQTDPTVAHAGLTEIDDGTTAALINGHSEEATASAPANASVADSAANAAGESQWDTGNEAGNDLAESQEWVEVKTTDVETPSAAAPPANQSWADDHPETPTETPAPAAPVDPNDGFQSVQRNRGNRDVPHRGRGRGGYRGRGDFRGDGRGRGRGGQRGGVPHRGPRRGGDES
ncbi:hypothetical protein GQ53DRAFT_830340 [Thozetella sp. PMI_491]|nr:hypothetical protein GQ53DRAFT_830340 [Thozetella sp. PMI_491]